MIPGPPIETFLGNNLPVGFKIFRIVCLLTSVKSEINLILELFKYKNKIVFQPIFELKKAFFFLNKSKFFLTASLCTSQNIHLSFLFYFS